MKKWTEYLPCEVASRLKNCSTLKSDLVILVNAKWLSFKESGKDLLGYTKEDALVSVLELLDCNGIGFDLTRTEYDDLKN